MATSVEVKIELGHRAECREKPLPNGFTHDWVMFIRGVQDKPIHHFVEKIVFYLHESFSKPKRVVREPPFQLKESGYAGFILPIEIYFKNRDEPKKVRLEYDLFLHLPGCPPVNHVRCEKLTFHNPTADFQKKLLKAGGVISRDSSKLAPSGNTINISGVQPSTSLLANSNGQTTTQITNSFPLPTPNNNNYNNINSITSKCFTSSTLISMTPSMNNHKLSSLTHQATTTHTTSHKLISAVTSTAVSASISSANPSSSLLKTSVMTTSSSADNISFTSLFGDPIKPSQQKDRSQILTINSHIKKKRKENVTETTTSTFVRSPALLTTSQTNHNKPPPPSKSFTSSSGGVKLGSINESTKPSKMLKASHTHNVPTNSPKPITSSNLIITNKSSLNNTSADVGKRCNSVLLNSSPLFDSEDSSCDVAFDQIPKQREKGHKITNEHKESNKSTKNSENLNNQPRKVIKSLVAHDNVTSSSLTEDDSRSGLSSSPATPPLSTDIPVNYPDQVAHKISNKQETVNSKPFDVNKPMPNISNKSCKDAEAIKKRDSKTIDEKKNTTNFEPRDTTTADAQLETSEIDDSEESGEEDEGESNEDIDVEDNTRQPCSPEHVMAMLKLQRDLMSLKDKHVVQRVVDVVVDTRKFTITSSTFDFDLCKLDEPTLNRIKGIVSTPVPPQNNNLNNSESADGNVVLAVSANPTVHAKTSANLERSSERLFVETRSPSIPVLNGHKRQNGIHNNDK